MITAKKLDAAEPKDKPYKLADGAGLYVVILKTGAKSWRCDYAIDSKRKPHVVPLSDFALSILKQLEAINGDYEFVFQSPV